MGLPSYSEDIRERAHNDKMMTGAFANGSAGAAGISREVVDFRKRQVVAAKARRAEAETMRAKRRTEQYVDDCFAWNEETKDVTLLRRGR